MCAPLALPSGPSCGPYCMIIRVHSAVRVLQTVVYLQRSGFHFIETNVNVVSSPQRTSQALWQEARTYTDYSKTRDVHQPKSEP